MNKRTAKRAIAFLLALATVLAMPLNVSADAWLVYDLENGKVLKAYQEEESLPIASVSKLMTVLIVCERVKAGDFSLDTVISTPSNFKNPGGSSFGIRPGDQYTVWQLVCGALVVSGNDAASVLGRYIGGTEAKFAGMMNERGAALGMRHQWFSSASGLNDESWDNYASAYDLKLLMTELYAKHWDILGPIVRAKDINELGFSRSQKSTNPLLQDSRCIGLKTGYTTPAGHCGTYIFDLGGRKMAVVLLGAKTSKERNERVLSLAVEGEQLLNQYLNAMNPVAGADGQPD